MVALAFHLGGDYIYLSVVWLIFVDCEYPQKTTHHKIFITAHIPGECKQTVIGLPPDAFNSVEVGKVPVFKGFDIYVHGREIVAVHSNNRTYSVYF